eukprot:15447424-Alexandrium_andersonii.AAC.1
MLESNAGTAGTAAETAETARAETDVVELSSDDEETWRASAGPPGRPFLAARRSASSATAAAAGNSTSPTPTPRAAPT